MKSCGNAAIPLEAQYLFRRGLEMMDQQKEETALVFLRQAVFIAPGFSKAYRELGTCLSHLGRTEEAAACWKKACRNDPGHSGPGWDTCAVRMSTRDIPLAGIVLPGYHR